MGRNRRKVPAGTQTEKENHVMSEKKLEDLTEKIVEQMEAFRKEAPSRVAGNKSAGMRARKATNNLTKLMKEWRALSV